MADRITKKMIERRFGMLCAALGVRVAKDHADKGAWQLDYKKEFGGYVISRLSERGGESFPMNSGRMPGAVFFEMMDFALRAIEIERNGCKRSSYYPDPKPVQEYREQCARTLTPSGLKD